MFPNSVCLCNFVSYWWLRGLCFLNSSSSFLCCGVVGRSLGNWWRSIATGSTNQTSALVHLATQEEWITAHLHCQRQVPVCFTLLLRSRICTASLQLCLASAGQVFREIKEHFWNCSSTLTHGQASHKCARAAGASSQHALMRHCCQWVMSGLAEEALFTNSEDSSQRYKPHTSTLQLHVTLLTHAAFPTACSDSLLHLWSGTWFFCKAPSASVCTPKAFTPPNFKRWEEVRISLFTVPKSTYCNKWMWAKVLCHKLHSAPLREGLDFCQP